MPPKSTPATKPRINKDEVLDGMVDQVFSEIDLPVGTTDWKTAMRRGNPGRELV